MPGRERRPGATLLLVLASVALVVVALEGGLRLLWRPDEAPTPAVDPRWAHLPTLHGVLQLAAPNARGVYRGVLHETNGAGIRGPERPREKPARVFRIAVTGDSITMGTGVLVEEAYPARVEQALASAGGDRRFEVFNLGVAGLTAPQVVSRLETAGLPFDPDLLVYGYTLNDIEGPHYRRTWNNAHADAAGAPLYVIRFLGPRWSSLRELVSAPPGSYVHELDDNYLHNPAAWADVTKAFDRFAALAAERGICAVLFQHTRLEFLHRFHPYRRLYDRVAAAAEARGIRVVSSERHFLGARPEALWLNAADPHPNREGHRRLGEALLEGLLGLPPACWGGDPPPGAAG